jgi:hypothetical protein
MSPCPPLVDQIFGHVIIVSKIRLIVKFDIKLFYLVFCMGINIFGLFLFTYING